MKKILAVSFYVIAFVSSMNAQQQSYVPSEKLYQVSIIDALLAGQYDGTSSLSELIKYGNFGIGTFDKLDGEMIVLDGKIYQFKTDGKIYHANLSGTTPFATVTSFKSDRQFFIKNPIDMKAFQNLIDSVLNNKNLFYAVKVTGEFKYVKTRSVPSQNKPYKPLSEVTKNQAVFEKTDLTGTLIGFRMPEFIKGINVPGYHLHFLTKDKKFGGHVLDFTLTNVKVEIHELNKFEMLLPEGKNAFKDIDLSKDRSKELEKVEK